MLDLESFRDQLQQSGGDYVLLAQAPRHIEFRCLGALDGRELVWDVDLRALGREAPEQYIDIGARDGDLQSIRIGLLLDELDQPSIVKTMMMIRQYKRLKPGRHSFQGPAKQ